MNCTIKGLVGGAAGLAMMQLAHAAMKPLVKRARSKPAEPDRSISLVGDHHRRDEGATDALGRIAYTTITHREPSDRTKAALSWAVHLAYGLAMASLYGAVRGRPLRASHAVGSGALFALGLWLVGDELAVPLLGLADKPTAYPAIRHVDSLVAHLAYGITTATTANTLLSR